MTLIAVGIGAGLVSALLFAVVATSAPLAVALSFVAPLPIFIAALGWRHQAGIVAGAAGAAVIALTFRPSAGLAFALGWALPAWWLAYLALLGRAGADGSMEWYPLGRLLAWIALSAALITTLGAVTLGGGNHEAYTDLMRRAFDAFARVQAPPGGSGPAGPEIIGAIVGLLPLFVASSFVMLLTLNLWLAGRIVAVSQRLPRPWPLVSSTQLPRSALGGAALALACSFLPGYGAVFGLALLGSLFIAFAFQGLAVLHEITLGRPNRTGLLVALYALLVFLSQLVLPVVALFGMADSAFGLRARLVGGGPSSSRQP